jgi:hypothetical protein
MSEEPTTRLPGPDADLASIASAQRLDRYLVELASLTEGGVETVVGLLVAGIVVVGRIVSEEEIALRVPVTRTAGPSFGTTSWASIYKASPSAAKRDSG